MAPENMDALARVHVPDPGRAIVAPADDHVPRDLDAPHTVLVAHEGVEQPAAVDVPDTQSSVARAGDGDRTTVEYS